jgi:hypothetical protein
MGVAREIPPIPTVFQGDNGRRHSRVRCRAIGCSNGELVDVSLSGARLLLKGRIHPQTGQMIEIEVEGANAPFTLQGCVRWCRSAGWRRHELGIEFRDNPDEVKKEIVQIAKLTARW